MSNPITQLAIKTLDTLQEKGADVKLKLPFNSELISAPLKCRNTGRLKKANLVLEKNGNIVDSTQLDFSLSRGDQIKFMFNLIKKII